MDILNKPLQQVPINNQLTQINNPGKYRFIVSKINDINTNNIIPTTKLESKNLSLIIHNYIVTIINFILF